MTEAEWNLINGTLVHLKQSVDNCESCHLDMDYTFIKEIVENNKPFEVEVGKEYVAKFNAMCVYLCEVSCIKKGEIVTVSAVNGDLIWFSNTNGYFYTDQFKACFKPL